MTKAHRFFVHPTFNWYEVIFMGWILQTGLIQWLLRELLHLVF